MPVMPPGLQEQWAERPAVVRDDLATAAAAAEVTAAAVAEASAANPVFPDADGREWYGTQESFSDLADHASERMAEQGVTQGQSEQQEPEHQEGADQSLSLNAV